MDYLFYWKKKYQNEYHNAKGEFFSTSETFNSLKKDDVLWVFGKYNSNYVLIGKFLIKNSPSVKNSAIGRYGANYDDGVSTNFDKTSLKNQNNKFEREIKKTKLNAKPWNNEIALHFHGNNHVKKIDNQHDLIIIENYYNSL